FYTGERMVAYDIEKRDIDWAKETFARKPFIWQNRPLPHQHHYGAIVDAIPWAQWQYDGFGDDVAGFMANQNSPGRAVALAAMNEALWNRKMFDRYDTVKRATEIFFGPGMYEILEPGSKAFYRIDSFMREGHFTPYMLKNIDEYEKLVKIARDAYDKAMAKDPERMQIFGGTGSYSYISCLSIAENQLKVAKSAKPDYFQTKYTENIEVIRELATKETGLNEEKGDLFVTPAEIFGGEWLNFRKPSTAFGVLLRGVLHQPRVNSLEFEFESAKAQAQELILYGQHEMHKDRPVTWKIFVNDQLLYEGETGFKEGAQTVAKYMIPSKMVGKKNTVRMESTMIGGTPWNGPWILINYAILRPTK
ncbi:MAG: hypothetical protein GX811_02810, partial [Lentisphaerae bacterium]|nr:hypothetical protein [Lentisphaerota bacterium]